MRSLILANGKTLAGGAGITEGTNAPNPTDLLPTLQRTAPKPKR